jgi:hypothetical protein
MHTRKDIELVSATKKDFHISGVRRTLIELEIVVGW